MIWELLNTPSIGSVMNQEVLDVLKESLTVHGYDGARRQLPNTIVEFNF